MPQTFPFLPNPAAPFQFQPVLDGTLCTGVVTWNLFGQRWYLNLFDASSNLIVALPLIGSVDDASLASLSWANGTVTATTTAPHGFLRLATVDLYVSGCSPAAFDGLARALVVDAFTLSWPLASDPGQATQLGSVGAPIDMLGGYFEISSMLFRESSQQFEVYP